MTHKKIVLLLFCFKCPERPETRDLRQPRHFTGFQTTHSNALSEHAVFQLGSFQKWELESLSIGSIGWGIAAWSSTEFGFARLQRFAIISTAWLGCTRLTLSSELLFTDAWVASIEPSSIQDTIDLSMFSLILWEIAGSISAGRPRSAHVVLANISGVIPGNCRDTETQKKIQHLKSREVEMRLVI